MVLILLCDSQGTSLTLSFSRKPLMVWAAKDEVRRPEAPPTRCRVPEVPPDFLYTYLCAHVNRLVSGLHQSSIYG